jgi:hypothetical protein
VQPTTITIITDARPCSSSTGGPGTPPQFIKRSQQQGGAGVGPDLPAHDERSDKDHRADLKHGPGPASLSTDLGDADFPQALAPVTSFTASHDAEFPGGDNGRRSPRNSSLRTLNPGRPPTPTSGGQ